MSNKNRSKRYDVASKKEVKANERRERRGNRMNRANFCVLALSVVVWIVAFIFPEILYVFGAGIANLIKFVFLAAGILAVVAHCRENENIFELIQDGLDMLLPGREYEYYDDDDDDEVQPAVAKRVCTHCNEELPEGKDFCPACGTKFVPVVPPAKRICTGCGEELLPGKDFCANCGTKYVVPVKRICKKCGSELLDGKDFCPDCGTKYSAATSKK
jgi:RNA polymerase subunit RPABC4/transcription elongation factor Spt4